MKFETREAPYWTPQASVASMMLQVLAALVPAAIAHVWFFGPGFIFNLLVAGIFAVAGEALVLRARGRPVEVALTDYSALVTAALLAFALPSLTPWWVTATGALFGVVVAKHLYGGLGFNIFNPAMAGYVVILVTFPMYLNLWTAPRMGDIDYQQLSVLQTLVFTLTGNLPETLGFDAVSRATPLDVMKSGLNNMATATEIRANPVMATSAAAAGSGSAISLPSADSGCSFARSFAGRFPQVSAWACSGPPRSCTCSTRAAVPVPASTSSPAPRSFARFSSPRTRYLRRRARRDDSSTAWASVF